MLSQRLLKGFMEQREKTIQPLSSFPSLKLLLTVFCRHGQWLYCCYVRQGLPLQAMLAQIPDSPALASQMLGVHTIACSCNGFWERRAVILTSPPSQACCLLSCDLPNVDMGEPQSITVWFTVFQLHSILRVIHSQLKPGPKFWIMNFCPTGNRQSQAPTEGPCCSCHLEDEQPLLYTTNYTGQVPHLPS